MTFSTRCLTTNLAKEGLRQFRERLTMLKRSLERKPSPRHPRLRVESCVDTILQLDKSLGKGRIRPEVVEKFERLKESLVNVVEDKIDEKDISRIEEATNQLLSEIRVSLGVAVAQSFHDGQTH